MKLVVPFVAGLLRPETITSVMLWAHGPYEFAELDPGDMGAYWALIDGLWAAGEAFIIVEQDIEIHDGVVEAFTACPEPWCVFAYLGPAGAVLDEALGCTRFSAELLAAEPDLFRSTHDYSDGLPPRDWRRVDSVLLHHLRTAGYKAHVHEPMVGHHHPY